MNERRVMVFLYERVIYSYQRSMKGSSVYQHPETLFTCDRKETVPIAPDIL